MNRPQLGHSSPCRRRAVLSRLPHHQMPMTAPAAHTPKRTHALSPRTLRPSAVMARAQMAKHTVVIPDSAAFGTRTSFRKALIRASSSCRVVGIKRLNQMTLNAVANGNYALIHQRVNRPRKRHSARSGDRAYRTQGSLVVGRVPQAASALPRTAAVSARSGNLTPTPQPDPHPPVVGRVPGGRTSSAAATRLRL